MAACRQVVGAVEREAREWLWGRELPRLAQWLWVEVYCRTRSLGRLETSFLDLAFAARQALGAGSESSVRRAVKRLEAEGLIQRAACEPGRLVLQVGRLSVVEGDRQQRLWHEVEEPVQLAVVSAEDEPLLPPGEVASASGVGIRRRLVAAAEQEQQAVKLEPKKENNESQQRPNLAALAARVLGQMPESKEAAETATARPLQERATRATRSSRSLKMETKHVPLERGDFLGEEEREEISPNGVNDAPRPENFPQRFAQAFRAIAAKLKAGWDGRSRPVYGWLVAAAAEWMAHGDGGKVLGFLGDAQTNIREGRTRSKDLGRLFAGWLKSEKGLGKLPRIKALRERLQGQGIVWGRNWDAVGTGEKSR